MIETEAERAVRQLIDELREARDTREDADRRMVGIRKLLDGYIELFPVLETLLTDVDLGVGDDEDDEDGPRPRGMDAALQVLQEQANHWFRVPAIVEMLGRRGWMPQSSNPRNAVRAALERLYEVNLIQKGKAAGNGAVIYRFFDAEAEAEAEKDDGWTEPPF